MSCRRKGSLRSLGTLLGAAMLALAIGCGDNKMATVSGKVTLDSLPLTNGTIRFVPADKASASAGGPIKDGAYTVEMLPGQKVVQISATKIVGKRQVYGGDPNSPVVDEVREIIPPQYNASSTLTVNVAKGRSQHDFDVKTAR